MTRRQDTDDSTEACPRLAVYGSLVPGRTNAHELGGIEGSWSAGIVRGHRHEQGWGVTGGYPGFVPDENGYDIPVQVLTSPDLIAHWSRLDAFEGPGYRRTTITVRTDDATVTAFIYEVAASIDPVG